MRPFDLCLGPHRHPTVLTFTLQQAVESKGRPGLLSLEGLAGYDRSSTEDEEGTSAALAQGDLWSLGTLCDLIL